jgi:hypothetical protein
LLEFYYAKSTFLYMPKRTTWNLQKLCM